MTSVGSVFCRWVNPNDMQCQYWYQRTYPTGSDFVMRGILMLGNITLRCRPTQMIIWWYSCIFWIFFSCIHFSQDLKHASSEMISIANDGRSHLPQFWDLQRIFYALLKWRISCSLTGHTDTGIMIIVEPKMGFISGARCLFAFKHVS